MQPEEIASLLKEAGFEIKSAELIPSGISFIVTGNTRNKFLELCKKLEGTGYLPFMRRVDGDVKLSVISVHLPARGGTDFWWVFASGLLTCATIGIDFQFTRYPLIRELEAAAGHIRPLGLDLMIYMFAFIVFFGLHEFGHKLASMRLGISTKGPYFIPGIPGFIPTFGAVILQNAIPRNRDELLDIGFSGPFYGFVALLIMTYFGVKSALAIPAGELEALGARLGIEFVEVKQPLINLIGSLLISSSESMTYLLGVIELPILLGFFVTFINMFPGGQLDGGHVSRALLGSKWHMILTVVSVIALFALGLWLMAIFVLWTWQFREHPGPLDDVSELSMSSKLKALVALGIFALSFTTF